MKKQKAEGWIQKKRGCLNVLKIAELIPKCGNMYVASETNLECPNEAKKSYINGVELFTKFRVRTIKIVKKLLTSEIVRDHSECKKVTAEN